MTKPRTPPGIAPSLLEDYKTFRITSAELATATGYNASYLRRTIKRTRQESDAEKHKRDSDRLRAARISFHRLLAHLPTTEIMRRANVSKSTALRIKKRYTEGKQDAK